MYPWQQAVRQTFESYVEANRIPHALLLAGPSGCGKVELAMDLARGLLCLEGTADGCGGCRSCRLLEGGAHPDYRELTFELMDRGDKLRDVITVNQVRRLIEALYKTTTISPRKVAIIHPAESMNVSAANALLKTLEEPAGDTVLILVTHDPGRLPATIRSRCQRLTVDLPARAGCLDWLLESVQAGREDAEEALAAAAGRPLQARALIESGSLDHYRGAIRVLALLRRGGASDGSALSQMAEYDPQDLWTWLSLRCAALVRRSLLEDVPRRDVKPLVELQRQADRNRVLAATPLRKDLLLRDWLIQWKNLPATLPLDRQVQEA
jgi:DNA polymerase-3 subunit delta'